MSGDDPDVIDPEPDLEPEEAREEVAWLGFGIVTLCTAIILATVWLACHSD